MTCATCIFFSRLGPKPEVGKHDDRTGQCCRYPPRVINAQLARTQLINGASGEAAFDPIDVEEASLFPITQPDTRCGEHRDGGIPL